MALLYRKFVWRPGFTLVLLALCVVFLSLGRWQCHRANEKAQIMQHYQQMQQARPTLVTADVTDYQNYQRVRLRGNVLNQQQFLLDNQSYQHRPGVHVLTPIQIGKQIILLNRGWIAWPAGRRQLPHMPGLPQRIDVTGYIARPRTWALSQRQDNPQQWPRIIQTLDYQSISRALSQPVMPFTARLDSDQPHGFTREWSVEFISPQRHRGYALQWFAFALVAIIILIGVSFPRRRDPNE